MINIKTKVTNTGVASMIITPALSNNSNASTVDYASLKNEIQVLQRHAQRQKTARLQAKKILEQKSYELFCSNEKLQKMVAELDERVLTRTSELTNAKELADKKTLALEKANQRFELVLDASEAGIWEQNLVTKEWYCSHRLAKMLSTSVSDVIQRLENRTLILNGARDDFLAFCEEKTLVPEPINLECQITLGDGSSRWFRLNASTEIDSTGNPVWIAGAFVDIHEHRENSQLIQHLATHDGLTNIANRTLFNDKLDLALRQATTTGETFSLVMLDLNDFKDVNDEFGHQAGDELLHQIASNIQSVVRKKDTVARLGGDEFAILLTNVNDKTNIQSICTNIIKACEKSIFYADIEINITVSMGISIFSNNGESARDLLKNADLAMYFAKKNKISGSTIHFFTSDLDISIRKAREFNQDIRRAIENQEFVLHYQPIYDIRTQKMQGVEALVRWPQIDGSIVAPDQFIPQTETGGLINSLGKWIIEEACKQAGTWERGGLNLKVAINLSPLQFACEDLPKIFAKAMCRHNLKGDSLEIEITESCMLKDLERVSHQLNSLREMGIVISIDDFGTGFSSLSYLHQLPIEIIKIDRSFVAKLDSNKESRSIVAAIIILAHSLGKKVTAEGVETIQQFEWLQSKNCDLVQGFYFSPGLPPKDLKDLPTSIGSEGDFT